MARRARRVRRGHIAGTTRSSTGGCSSRSGAPAGRGRARARRAVRAESAPLRPEVLPVPRQPARERRPQPGVPGHVRVHQRLRGAPARRARRTPARMGLLRWEGERGTSRVVCFSPRHDLDAREHGSRATCGASSTCGRTRPPSSASTTDGSRCSRTGAPRWAPRARIPTARSGPGRRCPPTRPARTPASAPTSHRRADRCSWSTRRRSWAARGSSRRDADWLVVVPFWAAWPFETLILPLAPAPRLADLDDRRRDGLADGADLAHPTL